MTRPGLVVVVVARWRPGSPGAPHRYQTARGRQDHAGERRFVANARRGRVGHLYVLVAQRRGLLCWFSWVYAGREFNLGRSLDHLHCLDIEHAFVFALNYTLTP